MKLNQEKFEEGLNAAIKNLIDWTYPMRKVAFPLSVSYIDHDYGIIVRLRNVVNKNAANRVIAQSDIEDVPPETLARHFLFEVAEHLVEPPGPIRMRPWPDIHSPDWKPEWDDARRIMEAFNASK